MGIPEGWSFSYERGTPICTVPLAFCAVVRERIQSTSPCCAILRTELAILVSLWRYHITKNAPPKAKMWVCVQMFSREIGVQHTQHTPIPLAGHRVERFSRLLAPPNKERTPQNDRTGTNLTTFGTPMVVVANICERNESSTLRRRCPSQDLELQTLKSEPRDHARVFGRGRPKSISPEGSGFQESATVHMKGPTVHMNGLKIANPYVSIYIHITVQGSGFRVQGSGFRVQGPGFRVPGPGFRVQAWEASHRLVEVGDCACVQGLGFRVSGSGFRVSDFGFRVSGLGFGVKDVRLRVDS